MYSHYEQKRRNCCGRTQEKQDGRGVPRSREARGRPQGETQLPPVPQRKEPVQKPRTAPKPNCSVPPPKPPPLPWEPPKPPPPACGSGKGTAGTVPAFLRRLLPNSSPGDLLALLILLLLLAEGGEDAQNTILTLLIFLFL